MPAFLSFRDGMARLASAVHIITTDGPAGRYGFTATAVCSVSDAPPTLLVCVNTAASSLNALLANGSLCVNTLASDQQLVARAFGNGQPMADRFATGEWTMEAGDLPRLADALVRFECSIRSVAEQGTHQVLFCAVNTIAPGAPGDGCLVYFDRRYHGLPPSG
ncbi:flavin reductase [Tianweitania sp. BSSL-BM11]|uniref:Flavin reductase n=1 Tax=Tianweitania aestuarii TaxID=2814886 RepID=A0ABS5RXT7_9HYPH|nr:flavin reductase [Tianweitania aestuarii]MBS9721834.1 flavin reductase [Tianweitania aestuarii]